MTTCPKSPPADGAPCVGVVECEYGDDIRLSCRTRAVCDGGKFALTSPKCPTLPGAGEAPCPGDLGASGSVCVVSGTLCNMHNGAFCECGCFGAGACGLDKWLCLAPPQGCPLYAPDVGQPCDGPPGQKCAYGACGSATRGARVCSGGYWVEGKPDPCPQ